MTTEPDYEIDLFVPLKPKSVRKVRFHVRRRFTHAELMRIAERNPPAPEWYDGEEERPF